MRPTFSVDARGNAVVAAAMRTPLAVVAILALSAVTTNPALAAPDELMPCKKLSVKADKADPSSGKVKFVCKAGKSGFVIPDGASSPLTNGTGMSLLIRDLGSSLNIVPGVVLPSSGWSGIGNPPGSKGFRYRDASKQGACRVVVVTTKQVAGKCRAVIGPGNLPVVGDVGMTLHFPGTQDYCGQLGGTTVHNDAASLLRKNSPAPASCQPVP